MSKLEVHKYLEPKYSESCRNLALHYSVYIEEPYELPSAPSISRERSLVNQMSRTERYFSQTPQRKTKPSLQTRMTTRHTHRNSDKVETPSNSKYYNKIMNTFLKATPRTVLKKNKKKKETLNLDLQDFWLIDDKIQVID